MKQSQPLRIEDNTVDSFVTSRTINSRLWFVNNKVLEDRILGYLAKYVEKHKVELYAYNIQGNHTHLVCNFPNDNRARFMQDLNARTAEAVRYTVAEFEGGPLFERRYSEQALVEGEDLEEKFFYTALQPVSAKLCENIDDYPGYNSFRNAVSGNVEIYKVVNWAEYRKRKKYNPNLKVENFTTYYPLEFKRLPEYKDLSQTDYKKKMLEQLEERRVAIVTKLKAEGHVFKDPTWLKFVKPGTKPLTTKKSQRDDYRPKFFCKNIEARKNYVARYLRTYDEYKDASKDYLAGNEHVKFPEGTYKPPRYLVRATTTAPA